MTKDRFRAKPDNRYQPKNLQALNERADDQIAPKAAAHSTDALQRWALATANIAQSGHRANEAQMVERIQSRYENTHANGASSLNPFKYLVPDVATTRSNTTVQTTASKRKHPISPTGSLHLGALYAKHPAEGDVRQVKRRRTKSPDVSSIAEDDTYAQSSEWSFPSDDEVQVTRARTYIEID